MNPPPVVVRDPIIDDLVPAPAPAAASPAPADDPPAGFTSTVGARVRDRLAALGWAVLGMTVFVALWHVATRAVNEVPSPTDTATELRLAPDALTLTVPPERPDVAIPVIELFLTAPAAREPAAASPGAPS